MLRLSSKRFVVPSIAMLTVIGVGGLFVAFRFESKEDRELKAFLVDCHS